MIHHVDTHVALWLFRGQQSKISRRALEFLKEGQSLISPIVELELEILFEVGKATQPAAKVLLALRPLLDLEISACRFGDVASVARSFAWTRDPFDRLIVANAMADGAKLITADAVILENFDGAVW